MIMKRAGLAAVSFFLLLSSCEVVPDSFGDYSGKNLLGEVTSQDYLDNYAFDSGGWVPVTASPEHLSVTDLGSGQLRLESLNQIPGGDFSIWQGDWIVPLGDWYTTPAVIVDNLVYNRKESYVLSYPVTSITTWAAGAKFKTHVEFQIDGFLGSSSPYFGFYFGNPTSINVNSTELKYRGFYAQGTRQTLSAVAAPSDSFVLAGQENATITVFNVRILESGVLDNYAIELALTRQPNADEPALVLLPGGTFKFVVEARLPDPPLGANQFYSSAVTAELVGYEPGATSAYRRASSVIGTGGWVPGDWNRIEFSIKNPLPQNVGQAVPADTVLGIRLYSFDISNVDAGVVEFRVPELYWEP